MLLLSCISIVLVYLQTGATTVAGEVTWPDGTYALPKPLSGCPDTGSQFTWQEGWRYQDTENKKNRNTFSTPLHLDGHFGSSGIRIEYCVKTSRGDSGTPWPNGSYCIVKKGKCPEGFENGSVYWDDNKKKINNNSENGTLPDGVYNHNTKVYYCCRNDTHPSNEIVLPTNKPFFLLRMHEDGCQQVKDTTVLMEYVFWDDKNNRNNDALDPPHPYDDGGTNDHRLYFCYYYKTGNESICSDGEIRLINGTNDLEGRVEICFGGVWGTVCDDRWDMKDATVVCRQLGYLQTIGVPKMEAYFGQGSGPIFLDGAVCSRTEQQLGGCDQQGYNIRDCDHTKDAGVVCQGVVPGMVEGQGQYQEDGEVPVCKGSEMTLNDCPHERPHSAICKYTLVQCRAKDSTRSTRGVCYLVENSTVPTDTVIQEVTSQIVKGVRRQCSCSYFASEVNISYNPCGSEELLYTVTVNHTENIATIVNDTITEVFENLYGQVSHVNCSTLCNDMGHSSFASMKTSLPSTKTHLDSGPRSAPTVTQVEVLPTSHVSNTQSSDSSTSSLLPPLLGTLSVLVVVIAVSVCVVTALIIVRHKRRKDGPQNLSYSPTHALNNPVYGDTTMGNNYVDANKLQAEIQANEPERILVNPMYGDDSQANTMRGKPNPVHMYEGIEYDEAAPEGESQNYEVPIDSTQAHYEDIPSGDVDTGEYSTLDTTESYATLTPAISQPQRAAATTTEDGEYSLVQYVPEGNEATTPNDNGEYSSLQHV